MLLSRVFYDFQSRHNDDITNSLAGKHFLSIEKFMSLLLFFQNWKIALLTLPIKVKLTVLMSNEETLLFLQLYFDKTREKQIFFISWRK